MNKLVALLCIFLSQFCFSQAKITSVIDGLKTESEVQNFVQSLSKNGGRNLAKFELKKIKNFDDNNLSPLLKRAADSLHINQSFYKGDFDHNGKTDLLFIGDDKSCTSSRKNADGSNFCNTSVKVAFDFGDSIKVKTLQPKHDIFVIPVVTTINQKDYIQVFYDEISEGLTSNPMFNHQIVNKILTYKFDNFVEYNADPTKINVAKIKYVTESCFGGCPVFRIQLNKNGESTFYAEYYNLKKSDKDYHQKEDQYHSAMIKSEDYGEIVEILNYINFSALKNNYQVNGDDFQTSILSVEYDGGKEKVIKDHGLAGTYGLKLLYEKLFALRYNQDWKKLK